jgi:hypothetical protein
MCRDFNECLDAVLGRDVLAVGEKTDCEWSVSGRADVFTDEAQTDQIFVVYEIKHSTKQLWRECRQDGSRGD